MSVRTVIYVRISQDRAGGGLGVARQEQDCRGLAKQLGWDVVDVIVDNDVSASTGRPRPGYNRLLDELRSGRANGVIVWHTDRLHRSPRELEGYVDLAEKMSVVTQTVKAGPLDLATPSGRAVARTLGAWARFEVEHKSERTRRAQQQAAAAGRWLGGACPFGWRFEGETPVIVEDEAAAVRDGIRDVLAGRTLGSVAKSWNARGLKSTYGNTFVTSTVRVVLMRARNAGLATWHGEVVGESKFPALVSEADWRAVDALLRSPNRPGVGTDNRAKHLLAGIARCHCGRLVKSATATGRKEEYKRTVYRCRTPGGSGHVGKTAKDVDRLVEDVIVARLSQPDALELLAPTGDSPEDLAGEAQDIRRRLDEVADAYARGTITLAQLEAATPVLRERLGDVEARMRARPGRSALGDLLLDGDDIAASWDAADMETRRAAVRSLLDVTLLPTPAKNRRRFDPETVQITWKAA